MMFIATVLGMLFGVCHSASELIEVYEVFNMVYRHITPQRHMAALEPPMDVVHAAGERQP
jgi:hypothetical protein